MRHGRRRRCSPRHSLLYLPSTKPAKTVGLEPSFHEVYLVNVAPHKPKVASLSQTL